MAHANLNERVATLEVSSEVHDKALEEFGNGFKELAKEVRKIGTKLEKNISFVGGFVLAFTLIGSVLVAGIRAILLKAGIDIS